MRGEQVARLYTLVRDLARSRQGIPAATLAERHGWKLRTVYRDLHSLEDAGFPVTQGPGAKWKLVDGWKEEVPFPLSSGELLSLYIARDLMRPLGAAQPVKDFNSLLQKLTVPRARRSGKQRDLFPEFLSPLSTPSALGIDYEPHAEAIDEIWNATLSHHTIDCEYYTASRGEVTQRRLDPYALHFDPTLESLYLFAWCHLRTEVRTFAVHRFRSIEVSEDTFEVDRTFDVDRHLTGAFRIWRAGNVEKIALRLAASASWVVERQWHPTQEVREESDGTYKLALEVADQAELRRFILGLGADVEVLEPAGLREEIAEIHEAALSVTRGGLAASRDSLTRAGKGAADDAAHG